MISLSGSSMLYLRIFLFLGLVCHKLVWEIMKRRDATSPDVKTSTTSFLKSVIKFVKIRFPFIHDLNHGTEVLRFHVIEKLAGIIHQ